MQPSTRNSKKMTNRILTKGPAVFTDHWTKREAPSREDLNAPDANVAKKEKTSRGEKEDVGGSNFASIPCSSRYLGAIYP